MSERSSCDTYSLGGSSIHRHPSVDLPPALSLHDIEDFDDTPFSESFSASGWIEGTGNMADASYSIERITDIKAVVPEWDDEEVDEIIVMSPKEYHPLPTILEDADETGNGTKVSLTMNDFEIFSGHAGDVCRRRSNGKVFALKRVTRQAATPPRHTMILEAVNRLYAPFLVRMHWSFADNDSLCMILDNGHAGDLLTFISSRKLFDPNHAQFYACELVEALSSLLSAGIIHRALRPENVMIDAEGHIMLTGFDDAVMLGEDSDLTSHYCCYEYRAPELLLGWSYDFAVDCWGFGALFYFILLGQHAFRRDKDTIHVPVAFDSSVLAAPACDLVLKCLERNPALRLSIQEIKMHDYFGNIDWRIVQDKQIKGKHFVYLCPSSDAISAVPFVPPNTKTAQSTLEETRPSSASTSVHRQDSLSSWSSSRPDSTVSGFCLESRNSVQDLLPPIFRTSPSMDKLLDTGADICQDQTLPPQSSYISLSDTPRSESSPQERMALFWKTLDEETNSPKLCRQRSFPILNSQRFSLLPPLMSVQNKLRKKRSQMSVRKFYQEPLNLPSGIEQIGEGIGFTYTLPAAALSKASICSTAPKSCHAGLGLGGLLRATGTRMSEMKIQDVMGRGSGSSDTPLMSWQDFSPMSNSDAGLLTPPPPEELYKEVGIGMKNMSSFQTLRLVSPSTSFVSLRSRPLCHDTDV
ncbi:kinase-like domain-containing protein [Armillaria luteobubalina]|uniref:Kinase-like domain-containing protein n=1 Tax=Armillaria luteobubalina TaxID=153913 RepID=A0AA39QRN9_9AGAR|nr:kinase-like domain-containing protein [Armillaria luteobubalina]